MIAFVRGRTIYVIHPSGGAIRRVFEDDDSLVGRPAWSPDGKEIAFALGDTTDSFSAIAAVRSTGGGLRYVTNGGVDEFADEPDYEPDWSPDGARIAFTRTVWFCGSCDQDEIFSVAADGSDAKWVTTDTASFGASRPVWSPRGDRIAAETSRGVAVLTAAGKLPRILDPLGTEPAWQRLW